MDKEVLKYLADLASVRAYANQIMSVSRSNINQKDLHSISGRMVILDKLFCDVLLGRAPVPGSSSPIVKTDEEDDFVMISQRLAEEKKKLSEKNKVPAPVVKPVVTKEKEDDDVFSFESEDDEELEEAPKKVERPKIKSKKNDT